MINHKIKNNSRRRAYIVAILMLFFGLVLILVLSEKLHKDNDLKYISGEAVLEGNGKLSIVKSPASGANILALKDNEIVKNLPNSAIISLKLGDEYYTVKKNSVTAGKPIDPDITISLPKSYSTKLSEDLCEVFRKANQNKEIAVEIHSSQSALLWKYKGMLKYKNCLS